MKGMESIRTFWIHDVPRKQKIASMRVEGYDMPNLTGTLHFQKAIFFGFMPYTAPLCFGLFHRTRCGYEWVFGPLRGQIVQHAVTVSPPTQVIVSVRSLYRNQNFGTLCEVDFIFLPSAIIATCSYAFPLRNCRFRVKCSQNYCPSALQKLLV